MAKIDFKVLPLFPEQVTDIQRFEPKDVLLFGDFKVNNTFSVNNNSIELHAYSQTGTLLKSDYNYKGYSFLQTAAGAGKSGESTINVDPVQDSITLGYNSGGIRLVYNFINNLFSPTNKNPLFYIESISRDRTEVRLLTTQLPNEFVLRTTEGIRSALDSDSYFSDFKLNFLNNTHVVAINISTEVYRNQRAVLVKLYEPLPDSFSTRDTCSIVEFISDSLAYEIQGEVIPEEVIFPKLAGPNFDIDTEDLTGTPSQFFNLNELFSYPVTSSYYELMSLANESGSIVSIDHSEYSQFVHFGSAEERLRNFKYKLQLLESYSGSIASLEAQSANNTDITGSIEYYEGLIKGVVNNFDHYDRFLYYESGSYSWPKSNSSRPYSLISSSEASTTTWFNDNISSASNFDTSNFNSLTNAIPAFVREDSDNNQLLTFVYMLGQHFDNIWVYQRALTDKYDADNRLDFGISKDLVGDALRSFGVKLYSSNESLENLFSYFTGQEYPSGSSNAAAVHVTASAGVNEYLQPMPKQAYAQEVYKRLYHNLPYLVKSKGTERGLRALINCYGIPSDVLTIRIHGNTEAPSESSFSDNVYLSPEENITSSLALVSSSLDNIFVQYTGSIVEGNTLSPDISIYKSPGKRSKTRHTLEVGFSTADNENIQIYNSASAAGGINIDDYIGAPNDEFEPKYSGLQTLLDSYTATNSRYDIRDFVNLIRFFDNTLFKSIKDYVPARTNASVGIIVKPNVLNRSKAKLVSGSLSQREYTGSKSIGTFTGADGGAFDTPFSGSTSYVQTLLTPSGSALQNYHNFEIAKIDGEFSGSLIIASSQSLSAGNSFTKESGLNLLFDIENFDASFICPFTVETFVPASPSPSITPTISNTPQVTPSNTPSISVTPSITVSKSITPTISVTPSITPSISGTPGVSVTPSISITPTISITPSPSSTPSISVTPSNTPPNSPPNTPPNTPPGTPPNTPPNTPPPPPDTPPGTPPATPPNTPPPPTSPPASVTPSVSTSPPPVSPTKTPSVSTSPPATRSSFTMSGGYGSSAGACADSVNTTYWSVSGGPSGVVYTSQYGSGTVSGGSYYTTGVTVYLAGGSGYLYPYGSCCVLEGTLISTSTSSSVAVETLAVSDSVLSKDINLFDDDMTVEELRVWSGSNIDGSQTNAIVTNNAPNTTTEVYNFNNGLLKTTESHTHVVKRGSEWITRAAAFIQVGDYFENVNGDLVEITSITRETGSFTVYTLNVETDDVYYAGGILTHNDK